MSLEVNIDLGFVILIFVFFYYENEGLSEIDNIGFFVNSIF